MPIPGYPFAPGLTIPGTPPAAVVNPSDLMWVWQGGQLLRATASQITVAGIGAIKFSFQLAQNAAQTVVLLNGCQSTSQLAGRPVLLTQNVPDDTFLSVVVYGTNQLTLAHSNNPLVRQYGGVLFI